MKIRYRLITPLNHAAIIGLFFLPFLNVKCNNRDFEKIKGIELATGMRIGSHSSDSSAYYLERLESLSGGKANTEQISSAENDEIDLNHFALAALLLAASGFILSLLLQWNSETIQGIIGLAGALSLVLMRIQMDNSLKQTNASGNNNPLRALISVEYLPAYWLVLVLFGVAGLINVWGYIEQFRNGKMKISDGTSVT